jgi:cystinosin
LETPRFQKGQQRVSLVCWALLGAILLFLGCSLIATLVGSITWLLLLNFCSYVKLGITLVKYMPQAFMNYRYSLLIIVFIFSPYSEIFTVLSR